MWTESCVTLNPYKSVMEYSDIKSIKRCPMCHRAIIVYAESSNDVRKFRVSKIFGKVLIPKRYRPIGAICKRKTCNTDWSENDFRIDSDGRFYDLTEWN